MAEIGLCLSGGGYRAALYHLGVLSYLNEVQIGDGTVLLDHIRTITSVSGGALPCLSYALCEAREDNRKKCFNDLYHSIVECNIAENILEIINDKSNNSNLSIVQALSRVLDDNFFYGAKFGEILDSMDWSYLHHVYVGATDVDLTCTFLFQSTPFLDIPNRENQYGTIGNYRHNINREDAKKIRLADIMAASSCFPLFFEPIAFPEEFTWNEGDSPEHYTLSYHLADGGVIDNQGITSASRAVKHMKEKGMDMELMILSDAAGGNKEFDKADISGGFITPRILQFVLVVCICLFGYRSYMDYQHENMFISGIFIVCTLIMIIVLILLRIAVRWITNKMIKTMKISINDNHFLWQTTFKDMWYFVKNRCYSTYKIVDTVMMGHIKKKSFRNLFDEPQFDHKVVINSLPIFSLSDTVRRILRRSAAQAINLKPTLDLINNSRKAGAMGTTFWFSNDEINTHVPEAILACGQYTICWNLLIYIEQLKRLQSENPDIEFNEAQKMILTIEPILLGDWKRFKVKPQCRIANYIE